VDINLNKLVEEISRYESGQMTEEEAINFFQDLVDSGIIWQLQGSYQREAVRLLNARVIK
tara:strand:+ start:1224 stop:1403 length:180 start_codon:yes stop_codon:yes gene_type:complete